MSINRNKMPDVSRMTMHRPQASAANQERIKNAFRSQQSSGDAMEVVQVVATELAETKDVVADMLTAWSSFAKNNDGIGARLQHVEQTVAMQSGRSGGAFARDAASIGSDAIEKLQEDPSFSAAMQVSARNMKPGQFSSRINLDNSIRAALTNEGMGNTGDTSVPSNPERRGIVGPVLRTLRLLDVLPSRPTDNDSVEFVQLNATGEAGEQIHEGDEKAVLGFAGVLKTANIVTIAGHTPASKQVLSDESALSQQIDRVIRQKVLSRLENQLINGPGGQGRINGLLNQATAFVAAIGATAADVIGEALVTMSNAGYAPGLVLLNPLDWFRIQLTRKNATDDEYVFGSPTMPVPPSLWNTTIVTTPSLAEGTAMVIDTSFITVLDREQVSIAVSNTHKDYFTRNLVEILGELRAGLEVLDVLAVQKFALPAPASS
jgi:HK97 family phage major capsid protein